MRPIPRISTRGYYDLRTGRALKRRRYYLYPARWFAGLAGSPEITIMVHGLRNDGRAAAQKALIARRRLRQLGYAHPVAGFSYDSNTTGAHLARSEARAVSAGNRIAAANGRHLGMFVQDMAASSPRTRIRLLGHSLGSQVIYSCLSYLAGRGLCVHSVHLFGASIPSDSMSPSGGAAAQRAVATRITNYYAPSDPVLADAEERGLADSPLGLRGAPGRTIPAYRQRRVVPAGHRFAEYAAVLRSFP
ncbi:MAG: TMCO4 family protein [Nitrosopumilus sp.]|nr:TMCO4 family protein [Nitrosopumilus sp.]